MMSLEHSFVILAGCIVLVLAVPATYDQRQSGDLNVQIHLKDLQVLALVDSELLSDDYTDYDYFYDYADFTIKPIVKPTTGATSSVEPWSTWPTNPPSSSTEKSDDASSTEPASQSSTTISSALEVSSTSTPTTTGSASSSQDSTVQDPTTAQTSLKESSTESSDIKTSINDKLEGSIIQNDPSSTESTSSIEELSSKKPAERLSEKRCRSGFSPDGKGRCRRLNRRRLSFIPLAMRFAPKLLGS